MNRSIITVFGIFILVASICGCVATKPLPPGLHTESKSAGGVKVLSVDLLHDDAGLLVHGTVQRSLDYFNTPFRHLDLEVIGPADELLSHRTVNFFPNPIPFSRFGPGRSTYTARLNEIPPPGSTIHVRVDCTLLSKCPLASVGSR